MKILRFLAWFIVPYIMLLMTWKKLKKPNRIIGIIWTVVVIVATIQGQLENKGNDQQASVSDNHKKSHEVSASPVPTTIEDTTKEENRQKSSEQSKPAQQSQPSQAPSNDFKAKFHPEIAAASRNGGLGDTFDQLKKQFGDPNRTNQKISDGIGQYNYQDDYQVVMFEEGRVSNITYQLDHKNNILTEKQAKDFALSMIPADSTLIKQYDKDSNTRVLLYHSKSLEALFDPQQFADVNGKVSLGQFDVVLIHDGDQVASMGAMLGDNP